jgi:ribosomal protein S25
MFNNHALQVSLTKKNKTTPDAAETDPVDPEMIAKITKDVIKTAAISVGVVIAANLVLGAICQIAVNAMDDNK